MTSVPTERGSERGWGHDFDAVVEIAQSFEFEPRLVAPSTRGDHHPPHGRDRRYPFTGVLTGVGRRTGAFIDAHRTALMVVAACAIAAGVAGPVALLAVSAAVVLMARIAGRVWAMALAAILAGVGAVALVGVIGARAPIVVGAVLWGAFGLLLVGPMVTDRVNRRRSHAMWAPAWVEGPRRVPIEVLQHDSPWSEIHPARKI